MKILYLKLRNFSQIFTAMRKKEIEIDFTRCKNNIILFVGRNGSGKTSLLSTLHPFAYPGNMDIRSGTSMIMENEDGYKEIRIDFDGVIYVIKHHYNRTSSGSITVKSYIAKDGEELNPNGNVTSFNDTVYNELSLQIDYLKLLRLGSNVTNIIHMKAAERKNFTSELLNDIGVYTELFKKISEDSRVLKRLLMAVSSKIERVNVPDKESLKRDIVFIEENIALLSNDKSELQREKGNVEGSINTLIPEGLESFRDKIRTLKSECESNQKQIKAYIGELSDIPVVIIDDPLQYYEECETKHIDLANRFFSINPLVETLQNNLNTYMNERDDISRQMSSVTSDENYKETEAVMLRLREEVKKLDKQFENVTLNITKDNVFTLMSMMNEIVSIVSETDGFGTGNVRFCISLIRDGTDVGEYVTKELSKLDKKIVKVNSDFRSKLLPEDCVVLFRPTDCCIDDCPYLSLYNRFFNKDPEPEEDESVVSLETQKEMLGALLNIDSNIEYIRRLLRTNQALIGKINLKQLTLEYILDRVYNMEPVYDEKIFTRIIYEIEDYDEYQKKKYNLTEIELKLGSMKGNTEMLTSLGKRLDKINDEIIRINESILYNKQESERLNKDIGKMDTIMKNVERYMNLQGNIDSLTNETDKLYEQIRANEDTLSKVKDYVEKLSYLSTKMVDQDNRMKRLNDELFDKTFKLKEYTNLIHEQETLSDKYDEVEIIKESLSSTKGIPLLFIQLFFKNIRIFVNQLLESVYDDFMIEDFSITSTEFSIPYVKNGVRVNDVVYASQGETSFLSLALSFALINNSIKDYNILLLDEIDSTLDTRNRSMFLNILNQQIDMIDAEQVFLITHNNMFDSYPVDIIITSDTPLDNYQNANIIYKA